MLKVLFHVDNPHNIPAKVGEDAMKAAISFVDLCIQHAAYLTGRGRIQDEVYQIMQGVIALMCIVLRKVFNKISPLSGVLI